MIDLDWFCDQFAKSFEGERWPAPLRRITGNLPELRERARVALAAGFSDDEISRAKRTLGSLINGECGERTFIELYASEMRTSEVSLDDDRASHSDADYILVNGSRRPLFRINIKFHGSIFRQAKERVNLEPEDCFPLATYKIYAALEKQNAQHLPFLFVIVTVPGLTADLVGSQLPPFLPEGVLLAKKVVTEGKRAVEERFLRAYEQSNPSVYEDVVSRLRAGRWFLFSARRAHETMKLKLFERVFALRQRGFNQAYGGAELNMHFSFAGDMIPLKEFLTKSRTLSAAQLHSMIERGTI